MDIYYVQYAAAQPHVGKLIFSTDLYLHTANIAWCSILWGFLGFIAYSAVLLLLLSSLCLRFDFVKETLSDSARFDARYYAMIELSGCRLWIYLEMKICLCKYCYCECLRKFEFSICCLNMTFMKKYWVCLFLLRFL